MSKPSLSKREGTYLLNDNITGFCVKHYCLLFAEILAAFFFQMMNDIAIQRWISVEDRVGKVCSTVLSSPTYLSILISLL